MLFYLIKSILGMRFQVDEIGHKIIVEDRIACIYGLQEIQVVEGWSLPRV